MLLLQRVLYLGRRISSPTSSTSLRMSFYPRIGLTPSTHSLRTRRSHSTATLTSYKTRWSRLVEHSPILVSRFEFTCFDLALRDNIGLDFVNFALKMFTYLCRQMIKLAFYTHFNNAIKYLMYQNISFVACPIVLVIVLAKGMTTYTPVFPIY